MLELDKDMDYEDMLDHIREHISDLLADIDDIEGFRDIVLRVSDVVMEAYEYGVESSDD